MIKFFVSFAVTLLFWGYEAAAAESVSLGRYLEMVRDRNPALRSGARSLEAGYYGVLASVSYQRPSLEGMVSGSYLTGSRNAQSDLREKNVAAGNAAFRLTHRIDLSGAWSLDERQQILFYEIQRAGFDEDVNDLMAAAEECWWSAVLARENIALQEDVLRQRRENNRVTEEKYKQQLVPRLDLIRSEAQVVEAESLVSDASAQYSNLLARLAALTGGTEVVPPEEPLLLPAFSVTATPEKMLSSSPEVRAARLALDRSRVVRQLKAKGLSPTLNAAITWMPFSDPWNSSSPQKGEMSATLSLNFPILDGGQTRYEVLNADRLVQAAEEWLRSVENSAKMDFAIAGNDWNRAMALEKAKKRQVERSDEEVRITKLMYGEGMGAQLDLINAQTENQRIRTDYLSAVRDMYVALVNLRKVAGDYAPDEEGAWKDAVIRYGRGRNVSDENVLGGTNEKRTGRAGEAKNKNR
ncbi:MAG: TolC family protein [Synergistaceae bacterium]|jgi:outer membrane protein TolC|nr:TolC family protein [Synergistaceae bacterium]